MLTLNQAQAIAAAAAAEAESLGMPVAVAVVDHCYGTVLALRQDGAKHSSIAMARSKAEAAAMAAEEKEYLVRPDWAALPGGGLPIHLSGRLAGGVGVSGAHPEVNDRDRIVAWIDLYRAVGGGWNQATMKVERL